MALQAVPTGYHTVTPYLIVDDVSKLLDYLKVVFDAEVKQSSEMPDGRVVHAAVQIGTSKVMIGGEHGEWKAISSALYLYVEDCDAVYQRALDAGGESVQEPEDQYYGDRAAGVNGPCGNCWWIATHVEDVSPEELTRRMVKARG